MQSVKTSDFSSSGESSPETEVKSPKPKTQNGIKLRLHPWKTWPEWVNVYELI